MNDPRKVVGTHVQALATRVISDQECQRRYDKNWKVKKLDGIVDLFENEWDPIHNRRRGMVTATYQYGNHGRTRTVKLCLQSVKLPVNAEPGIGIVNANNEVVDPHLENAEAADQQVNIPRLVMFANAEPEINNPAAQRLVFPEEGIDPDEANNVPVAVNHDVPWYENDELLNQDVNGEIPEREWSLRTQVGDYFSTGGNRAGNMSRLDMFLTMFPPNELDVIILETNIQLRLHDQAPTTMGEIIKLFGIFILITKYEFTDRKDLWRLAPKSKYENAGCFGQKTGMSRHRFDNLWHHIRFGVQPAERPEDLSHAEYRWLLVDDFVNNFNQHRANMFSPSHLICVDESISRWYGLGGSWINKGLPMYIAIDRKPENGCEIQNSACGVSGVMLQLKIVKGAIYNGVNDENYQHDMNHGTRVLMELVEPWFDSRRIVCADSYYSSVSTAQELLQRRLRFIGVVKTATRKFPMAYLQTLEMDERGEHKGLYTPRVDTEPNTPGLMALVWMDRERRYFVSSCSNVSPGQPYTRKRWRQLTDVLQNQNAEHVEIEIPQPKVAEIYYTCCAKIDQHNRDRQDTLGMEKKLGTHDWAKRVNISILSINIVDTWKVWDLTTNMRGPNVRGGRKRETQQEFYSGLLKEMIENTLDNVLRPRNNVEVAVPPEADVPGLNDPATGRARSGIQIHITPTRLKRKKADGTITNQALQGRCRHCQAKTKWCCSACLDDPDCTHNGWICHTSTQRRCFPTHVVDIHNN
jgi:hypothetical protein